MLTTAEIQAHLADFTYLPGWRFIVYDGEWEGQHLVITAQVLDSRHVEEEVYTTLDVHSMLPPIPDTDYLNRWLVWRLARLAIHEVREFARVKGEVIFDPHAPDAERDNPHYQPSII